MTRQVWIPALLLLAACPERREGKPVVLVFPGRDAAAQALGPLLDARVEPARSYLDAVERIGAGSADAAFLNDFGYLLARDLYGAEPALMVERFSSRAHKGALIVPAAGAAEVRDLAGKRVAFANEYSTSGFLYAAELLRASGVTPGATSFAGSHEEVVRRVYRGESDAGAVFWNPPAADGTPGDARRAVLAEYPDLADKVRVLATTAEIPNEPVAFRKGIDPAVRGALLAALTRLPSTGEGRAALKLLGDVEGFSSAADADYAPVRALLDRHGKAIEDMVPGGWKLHVRVSPEVPSVP
jgi:phosphonate transport system substrate-binding protein